MTTNQVEQFIETGYVRINNAFTKETASQCRDILWKATQVDQYRPETWTQPVIRIGEIALEPFRTAANTPVLHQAFNQLAGSNWLPRFTMGSFPVRFPVPAPAGDTGWHVDASFPGNNAGNILDWRINIHSKGRALLMLFLFSDVEKFDAPTVIREGSHLDVAKLLYPEGDEGMSFMQLATHLNSLPKRPETIATGDAGTVYLCHPFLVHAAQDHRGKQPRFLAQPPLLPRQDFNINQPEQFCCPVEKAIIKGIHL